MNTDSRSVLYTIGTIVLVVIAISFIVWTFKVPTIPLQNVSSKQITVSAEGKVDAKPDTVSINAGVETKGKTAEDTQKTNDIKMTGLIAYLKTQGIEEKNIKTSNYSLYPEYFYPQDKEPILVGFILNQTVEIKITDLKKVNTIIGNLTNKGVNFINSINFVIDEPQKYQSEARLKAIEKAKTEAQKIAKSLGVKLGKIASYNEGIVNPPFYPVAYRMAEGIGGVDSSPIETGSQEIRVNVNLVFEIQ